MKQAARNPTVMPPLPIASSLLDAFGVEDALEGSRADGRKREFGRLMFRIGIPWVR